MKKIYEGVVVSLKMQKTAVVRITSKNPHPLYKKLIKSYKKVKADIGTLRPAMGDMVKIVEVKPISATKNFKILEVIKDGSA